MAQEDENNKVQKGNEEPSRAMSFLQHLELLRWHIIRSLIAVVVFAIAAFIAKDFIFGDVIFAPSRTDFITYRAFCKASELISHYLPINADALCIQTLDFTLQSRKMTGQFTMHLMTSFVVGLIVAFPYTFWEIWRFVGPGLKNKERSSSRGAVVVVSFLFMTGILFGYFVVSPLSINFLAGYSVSDQIINEFDITSYVNTLTTLVLTNGLLFQLPVVAYFLSKAGLVTPSFLRSKRRHSIVVILLLSAVITPPDVVSQLLIALPLFILYEVSIIVSSRVVKNRLRDIGFKEDELDKEMNR